MKTLSLLRHAHAEKHSDDGSDFTRRLDARGLEEAVEIADWAKRLGLGPERLIASPALRTRMTARAVTEALALADSQVNFDHRVYEASRPTLTDLLWHPAAETGPHVDAIVADQPVHALNRGLSGSVPLSQAVRSEGGLT
jgi:phosphohistidine phosphatase SixA